MRIWYRLLRAVIVVLMLVVGTSGTAVIVSQTAWFKNWLRGYIVAEAHKYVNGQVSIERLGGNLFFGVELEGIEIAMDGSPVVSVKDIGLGYNLFQLVTKGMSAHRSASSKLTADESKNWRRWNRGISA